MKIYAIYDIPARQVACCFPASSDAQARRMLQDLLTNPEDNLYTLHPGDFAVYLVCEHNESSVRLNDFICVGSDFTKEILESLRLERCEYLRKYNDIMNLKIIPLEGNLQDVDLKEAEKLWK